MNKLINKEWNTNDGWMAPTRHLKNYKSVIHTELIQTTSSTGDWNGLLFQKIGNKILAIPYLQYSNYPYYGYTLCTDEVFTELQTTELTPDTIDWVIENYLHSL